MMDTSALESEKNDWRLRGQEEYMQNLKFRYINYIFEECDESSHEHCEFCWHKFMERDEEGNDCSREGYCSEDKKYWVCDECFQDFKRAFGWELIE